MVNRFAPIDQIHQALHAYHVVADHRGDIVSSVHYCSCTTATGDLYQCLIYDSDQLDAKLIGVEYMIPESKFVTLPEQEQRYWHSHVYEVMSGSLVLIGLRAGVVAETVASAIKSAQDAVQTVAGKGATGGAVPDAAELAALNRVKRLYGKAIHLWHPPTTDVPMGAPRLMMPVDPMYEQVPRHTIEARDVRYGIDTVLKKQQRQEQLSESYVPHHAADHYVRSGTTLQFTAEERQVRPT